jgi:hypothetical protein
MPLVSLDIPPGFLRHGTDRESTGRWRDGNLVRFRNGVPRPIGGWQVLSDPGLARPARAALAWLSNNGSSYAAFGSFDKLHAITTGGTVYDITPADLATGEGSAGINYGYGGGLYGAEAYGVARLEVELDPTLAAASTWTLDSWGEYLVACSDGDGRLFEWTLNTATPAALIANAPLACRGLVVTAERFVFALGANGNPRLVRWCDREDNTDWTPTPLNEAGDLELQTVGELMCGVRVRGRTLLLTNQDAHAATYSGPPTVYGIERVGTGCGAVSRQCARPLGDGAMWMGPQAFFMYDGSKVVEVPCEVQDHVFRDINTQQISKVSAVENKTNGEIWWFYPSQSSTENDRYVAFDYTDNHWLIGSLPRTCGVDQGVYRTPIWADPDGVLYDHETETGYEGQLPYLESGPVSLGNGDQVMCVTEVIPDELNQGGVALTFKTRFHPNDVEREYGPYSTANPTSARFTGRQVRMRLTATGPEWWTVGSMRLDVTPGGRR